MKAATAFLVRHGIQFLQQQAREVLAEASNAAELHRAQCRFARRIGQIYHLYRRPDGTAYFSLLSPDDWAGEAPHAFVGSYRLEPDMGWTPCADDADP